MTSKHDFIRNRVLETCTAALVAGRDFDADAMDAVWRSFQNIANEMARTPIDLVLLDDSVDPDMLSYGYSEPVSDETDQGGGDDGYKVKSAPPKPVRPSGGIAKRPTSERRAVPNLSGVSL